ncbi:MotA/TolQ/ExbB proton channel family protein [Melioribacteraceae bacterium 4301-Me]|uniref:MotA/TolQ/ExbB proton channel family protein n=1 Tax=Pyranulibacter aquaticus TaxID=3163344 RepID=UPI00359A5E43
MKQSAFIVILFILALAISISIYQYGLGNPVNFKDGEGRSVPLNIIGQVYTGGPLVSLLIALSIMDFAIIIERSLSLRKASGKKSVNKFFSSILDKIRSGQIDESIQLCEEQRGSVANVIRAALQRYKELVSEHNLVDADKQLAEVQRSIEEAMMLETPLLEKNLIALSTIASIATMVGLLGTVLGMIRAFRALAQAGAPDAIQLATGISEALVNTAGGLFVAILGIVAYNFFVNKVDNFTYQVDEASYNVIQLLKTK